MIASWRTFCGPITALLMTTLACGGAPGGIEAGRAESGGAFVQSIERPGGEPILVLMPNLPQAKEIWRGMSDELRAVGLNAVPEGREGDAATEVIAAAQATNADLIVIGTHGRTGLSRLVLGSVARNVLHHATCSVLIAREPIERS